MVGDMSSDDHVLEFPKRVAFGERLGIAYIGDKGGEGLPMAGEPQMRFRPGDAVMDNTGFHSTRVTAGASASVSTSLPVIGPELVPKKEHAIRKTQPKKRSLGT